MKKIFFLAGLVLSLNAIAQVPSYVPTTGLFGWWPFDGNANDESGNGNNGTVNGATLSPDRFGNLNSSFHFDGISNFIQVADQPEFEQDSITISYWIKADTFSPGGRVRSDIVGKDIPSQRQWVSQLEQNGKIRNTVFTSSEFTFDSDSFISLGQWYHIVKSWDGFISKTYINGFLVGDTITSGSLASGSSDVYFGGNTTFSQYFMGQLDDIGMWNRALTQQEITDLYNGCTTASITSGSTTICGSGSILLTANANTTYQWKKNNVVIAGATNQTYSATTTGSYTVTAINSCGTSSTSNAIQITKYSLPTSTITASGATSFCTGGSVTLTSTTNAGANALYQWYKGATAISGATNSSYIAITASTYKCKVTNSLTSCNRTSAGIIVTLHDPTSSITAGGPLTFCAGGNVLFTAVTNAGAGALYQWYKNSTGLSGATNSTYTATVAGNYVVVVTNSYGCTKASAVKKVIINCRLEDSEISSSTFYVSPNPCSTCFVNGTMNERDLIVTDIVGRKINVQFTKSENGFYINLSENDKGIFLIRNIKSGEVVKFVKE